VERVERARARMGELGVDVLLLSVGPDLPWLTGYEATPLERLTMLVLPRDGDATLVVPRLEAPRVEERPELFSVRAWEETEDPTEIVAGLAGSPSTVGVGDRTWSRFLLDLQARLPGVRWRPASEVTAALRAIKDADEIAALRAAAAAVDRIAARLQAGDVPLVGRTEHDVAGAVAAQIRAEGHQTVNFVIVASGPNAASPHHDPGDREIEPGEIVLFDFGGTMNGYCSDITRCVHVGEPPAELRDLYAVLAEAQAEAVDAAMVGVPCEDVDGVARRLITEGGYGDQFVHRTGHGIGMEAHEDPYLVAGNCEPLAPGHAFSVEPGIYVDGRWGARIEDIVVATEAGPEPLNTADHALAIVEA